MFHAVHGQARHDGKAKAAFDHFNGCLVIDHMTDGAEFQIQFVHDLLGIRIHEQKVEVPWRDHISGTSCDHDLLCGYRRVDPEIYADVYLTAEGV